jgi:hypothetical protein
MFIARISGGALGVIFALLAFILQWLIRRSKLPALGVRIISAAGAIGGIYIIAATVRNLLRYAAGVSSIITVSAPFLAFALALTVHFILILLNAPDLSAPDPKPRRILSSNLTVALLVSLQLAFALFNLIRNWNNLTHGMKEFLYLQLLALVFIIITALLFWISFGKTKAFAKKSAVRVYTN